MKDTRLLQIFQNVKDTICKYDYYIHTSKKIIHLSNTEDKIPHLMGLQYAGRPKQYTGDFGAYAVKKGRITMQPLEKLVQKYYKLGQLLNIYIFYAELEMSLWYNPIKQI